MGNLNFLHFATLQLQNAENVQSSRSENYRNLSFWFFAPFVTQKAKKVQNPYSGKSELSAFSAQSKISESENVDNVDVHIFKIESVTMCVDGDDLFETPRISSRPSRIVTGNMYSVSAVPHKAENAHL